MGIHGVGSFSGVLIPRQVEFVGLLVLVVVWIHPQVVALVIRWESGRLVVTPCRDSRYDARVWTCVTE